jgi:transcriptional/translational regulatory protein YebC/TACO1
MSWLVAGGSTDPENNTALATVLRAAKASAVPKENIERALAKVRHQILEGAVCSASRTGKRRKG